MADPRLSERLGMILEPTSPDTPTDDSDLLLTPRWLLKDAARLAELHERALDAVQALHVGGWNTHANYDKAVRELLAFDLSGGSQTGRDR